MNIIFMPMSDQTVLPTREKGSVGYDVYAYGDHNISPGETKIIPLGFRMALPCDYAAFVWDRSSYGAKGIHIFKDLIEDFSLVPFGGVLDYAYRGQCGVILHSFCSNIHSMPHGTKVAQFIVQKCEDFKIEIMTPEQWEASDIAKTDRGEKGLGCSDGQNTSATAQKLISDGGKKQC